MKKWEKIDLCEDCFENNSEYVFVKKDFLFWNIESLTLCKKCLKKRLGK